MKRVTFSFAALLLAAGPAWSAADVNTATKEQLEAEGIGPIAAQAILDYRARNGAFKSPEEARNVIINAITSRLTIGISLSGPSPAITPAPKAATPPEAQKPAKPTGSTKDDDQDNVRKRAREDQDDRKT